MAPQPGVKPPAKFVGRQPILSREEQVFGYELLFRDGTANYFTGGADAEAASRSTLDSSLLLGLDVLCAGRRAFVNCPREVLLKDYITLLPPQQTVVEVLETVEPDPLVMAACQRLKEKGYMIALDDFVANDPRESMTDLADIIKVDMLKTTLAEQAAMIKKYGPWRCRMLAEKVETREAFLKARDMGFVYFQGYFFCKPEVLTAHEIPANRLNYLRLLQAVSKADLDPREIENLIKSDAAACYRLLRYLNSAAFGFATEIHSIRHALSLLGEREIRRWIRLVATLGAAEQKSTELVTVALGRARFCELLSPKVKHGDSDLFLMGLLSLIDTILEAPMSQLLEQIPVDKETKAVLLGTKSSLRPIYQLMLAQESGEFDSSAALAKQLKISEEDVAGTYWEAMQWVRQLDSEAGRSQPSA